MNFVYDDGISDYERTMKNAVCMGMTFSAKIRWLDDGTEEDVLMATYDTEGLPEDEDVFFSFGGDSYGYDGLINELKNWHNEWEVVECELF